MTDNNYQVDVSNQSDPEAIDLLRAFADGTGNSGYDKTYSGSVALAFDHKLTRLIIKTEAATGMGSIIGMNVTITGMNTKNTYHVMDNTFGTANTPGAITPQTILDGIQYEAIILPREIANKGDVKVTFTVAGEPYVWEVPAGTKFKSGEEHIWTITLTPTGVEASGTINLWKTGTGGSGIAE